LKVGEGAPIRLKAPEKNFLLEPLHFLALKVQLVVLAFVMVSAVWPVSCLLFFYSRCPGARPFVKVGTRASVPHESAPLVRITFSSRPIGAKNQTSLAGFCTIS